MTVAMRRKRRVNLTDKQVAEKLRPKPKRYFYPDPELPKHGVRVQPDGAKSYYVITRDPWGKQRWVRIGSAAELKVKEARDKARDVIKRIEAGEPAFPPAPAKPDLFKEVAATWLRRHVEKERLRSQAEIERCLGKYVYPVWGDRPFSKLRRGNVTELLDAIEDRHGARQADLVLAIIGGIMRWHAARGSRDGGDDDYVAPIVPGMRRWKAAPHRGMRVLDDDEIRALWACVGELGTYGAIVKVALLTAQRREKVATMKWGDLAEGTWQVRREHRQKGTPMSLWLPEAAIDIIDAQPRCAGNEHVFPAAGGPGPFNSFSQRKAELDVKMREHLPDLKPWVFHDLRRTARSLLSRAGVSDHHAERVLGHAIAGIGGIYDRYGYNQEIGLALGKLAALVKQIIPAEVIESAAVAGAKS